MSTAASNGFMSILTGIGPIILILVLLVVMMILPQKRQEKKVKEMMAGLKPNDRIRTIGGVYGRIDQVKDDVVVIKVDPDGVRMTFSKGAISKVEDTEVENDPEIKAVSEKEKKDK